METELAVMKRALAQELTPAIPSPVTSSSPKPKLRIPKLVVFGKARSSKELENFIWDAEQFFMASYVPDEDLVQVASASLIGNTKIWWRT